MKTFVEHYSYPNDIRAFFRNPILGGFLLRIVEERIALLQNEAGKAVTDPGTDFRVAFDVIGPLRDEITNLEYVAQTFRDLRDLGGAGPAGRRDGAAPGDAGASDGPVLPGDQRNGFPGF